MNKDQKSEEDILDELNKGACMGVDAINFILPKVEEKKLEKELKRQEKEYKEILDEIANIYPDYSDKKPHETNFVDETMTWWGIEMKTLKDKTTSKLAELLMQGTNMGIIEGRRLLNQVNPDYQVKDILDKYVGMQEKAIEKLKEFL